MYRSKIKIAYCLVVLLLVCSCGAEKKSLPEKSLEQGEQSEIMRANLQEESIMRPDVSSLSSTQSIEHKEVVEDVQVSQYDEPSLPLWPDDASSPMEVYRAILHEDASFVDVISGDFFDIAHIKEMLVPDVDFPIAPDSFSIVDLDNDGTPELILSVPIGSASGFYLVLRCEDSTVYSFSFSGRALDGLKKDGTFWSSGGATNTGICSVTFSKDQYTVDKITHCITSDLVSGNVEFFVDHEEASEAEWNLAVDEWRETPYADWYEYTDQNIDRILS